MQQLQKYKKTQFGELTEDWRIETLGRVSEKLVVGFVGTCDPFYTDNKGIPMIRTTNVKEGHLDLSNLKYVTREFHEKNKKSQLKENDLVVARHGENGEASLVKGLKEANCLSVVIIRPHASTWIPEYFEFAFNSSIVRKQISRRTGGGVQTVVNTSEIAKVSIPIPDLQEQRKIAHILSTVVELIQKTDQIIELTQRLKKGLMQRLLTKGIGHAKYKKTELGEIPESWELCSLIEFVDGRNDIVAGPFGSNLKVSDYRTDGVPIIRLQNIERNRFINENIRFISQEKAEELKYHSYKQNDIVLAKLGDPIGKTCIIPENVNAGIVVADVVRIRPSKETDTKFLEYVLNSDFCSKQMNGKYIGTTRPRVNLDQIRYLKLFKPSLTEQRKIASILSKVDELIQKEQKNKSKFLTLKKGLMQQLLTGKIRVKV